MIIDIVILPPPKLRRIMGEKIRKADRNFPSRFLVDNRKFIPHLSLWHLSTHRNRIREIKEEIQKIVANQKPITICSKSFRINEMEDGFVVSFAVSKSRLLTSLQNKIFKRTHLFKTGMMPEFKSGSWTDKNLKEAKKYGRPIKFSPHFTMGWFKNREDALLVHKKMKKFKFKFTAKEVYLCRANRFWQVDKILKEFIFN